MTLIKRKNGKNSPYRIIGCKISCHTMSEVDDTSLIAELDLH